MNSTNQSTYTVGDAVPDLALAGMDSGTVNLSDLRGKKYILFMWASW